MPGFNIWFFLTLLIDTVPVLVMHYIMFRDKMKYPFGITISISLAVNILYDLMLCFIYGNGMINERQMVIIRMMIFIILLLLKLLFIPHYVLQNIYMVFLSLPYVIVGIAVSAVFVNIFNYPGAPPFMIITLGRMFIYLITIVPIYILWNRFIMKAIDTPDRRIWLYAILIQFTMNMAVISMTASDYAQNGIDAKNLYVMVMLMAASLMATAMLFHAIDIMSSLVKSEEYAKREQMLIRLEEEQYEAMTDNIEEIRHIRHDLRHHMSLLQKLLAENKTEEAKAYLEEYSGQIPSSGTRQLCSDPAINALLGHYMDEAQEQEIDMHVNCEALAECGIDSIDLCIVLGNAVENAIEACLRIPDVTKRFINASASVNAGRMYIVIDNSFNGELKESENGRENNKDSVEGISKDSGTQTFLSSKRGFKKHGYGMSSISSVASKHGGSVDTKQNDNVFSMAISMEI